MCGLCLAQEDVLTKVESLSAQENYVEAISEMDRLIEVEPSQENYYVVRGKLYFKTEDYQSAVNDFSMSLDIVPTNAEANYLLGVSYLQLSINDRGCYYLNRGKNYGYRQSAKAYKKFCR